MQILVDGNESVLMSIHYDHGTIPEIIVIDMSEDRVVVKEIIIGKVTIQVFERDK